jgi:hypothetical protein
LREGKAVVGDNVGKDVVGVRDGRTVGEREGLSVFGGQIVIGSPSVLYFRFQQLFVEKFQKH